MSNGTQPEPRNERQPSLFDALRQKAERHIVYPLNRDECIGLVKAVQAVEGFAAEGLIDRDIAGAVLFHVEGACNDPDHFEALRA